MILILIPTFAAFYGAILSWLITWLFNATTKRTGGLLISLEN